MVKYSPSKRDIPRAEPKGFPKGSGCISPYILTKVIIQTFSISKSFTSSIVFPDRAILEELILRIGLATLYYSFLAPKFFFSLKKFVLGAEKPRSIFFFFGKNTLWRTT